MHVRILNKLGHSVSIIGSDPRIDYEDLPVANKIFVPSCGSGSLYSPARVDIRQLTNALSETRPKLVIVEGWQTALTDYSITVAHQMGIRIILISHGISLHPFKLNLLSVVRSLGWAPYWFITLPRLLKKVSLITTLDLESNSNRFYDRILAKKLGISIKRLVNTAVNWEAKYKDLNERERNILVVGYFSSVKNQKFALKLMKKINKDINLRFIGAKKGAYYESCKLIAKDPQLSDRIEFVDDRECDIASEIASCRIVLSTSTTEVLPLTLLEAMASGTPFVASHVGAVPSLRGGIALHREEDWLGAIESFFSDSKKWNLYSQEGRNHFSRDYTIIELSSQLEAGISGVFKN
jgi:glycosyltransferase involved in cell wall biosynthesis